MFILETKKTASFGLDVGGESIKVFQLDKHSDTFNIKAFSEVPFPKGMLVNDVVVDEKTFVFLLQQALSKPEFGKVTTNYVVASLPESKSFVRVIQIPIMTDSEAESAIPVEAESFIPMPMDQVYLDWQKLGVKDDKMNILIIASPKDQVNKFLGLLDKAGLKTIALEVESQSCQRAVVEPYSKDTQIILDLDANRSSLIMIEEGHLQFTSTVPIAGNSFTQNIAKYLDVSNAKAEEIKRRVGIANTADYPNIKTSLLPVLDTLVAEVKNILKFHQDHSEKKVSKILLVGGSAKLKNLPEYLAPHLTEFGQIVVTLGNPWQNIVKVSNGNLNNYEALGYTTAIGLALRNLL
jgi:type IV pilus assembly protein PilM